MTDYQAGSVLNAEFFLLIHSVPPTSSQHCTQHTAHYNYNAHILSLLRTQYKYNQGPPLNSSPLVTAYLACLVPSLTRLPSYSSSRPSSPVGPTNLTSVRFSSGYWNACTPGIQSPPQFPLAFSPSAWHRKPFYFSFGSRFSMACFFFSSFPFLSFVFASSSNPATPALGTTVPSHSHFLILYYSIIHYFWILILI